MNRWIVGARPRTLPAAVVPVALGVGCAAGIGPISWWRAALALVVSLALQVGVNYANDYCRRRARHRRRAGRTGAPGGVGAGGAGGRSSGRRWLPSPSPRCAGLALAASTSWWLIAVGAASIAAAWFYTGGPRPYGYLGLGEVFVFVFFGLVATVGTTYVSVEDDHRAERRRSAAPPASWPAPCSWSTTCATSRPTRWPASGRWPCASASSGRGGCTSPSSPPRSWPSSSAPRSGGRRH